jgi:hypothetical protein
MFLEGWYSGFTKKPFADLYCTHPIVHAHMNNNNNNNNNSQSQLLFQLHYTGIVTV